MRRYERRWWWAKEKKHMALVFIAITMILQLQMRGCVGCLEAERIGLLQLKSYLNSLILSGEEVRNLESWSDNDPKSDCCLWERVNCTDTIGGHVVNLSLNYILPLEYLHGDASVSLNMSLFHTFPQLQSLDFSVNGLSHLFDPIHGYKSFQRLEKLRTLDLSINNLNNSVLPFISASRSLMNLNLSGNELNGVFPSSELANMTELRVLNLHRNRFNSFSIQGLINLKELEVLDLSYNIINDIEAGEGLKTMNLKTLDLSFNSLSEAARLEVFKDMSKLQELDLTGNGFIDLDNLGVVFPSSLQVLSLTYNHLSLSPKGYSKICALVNLQELDLSINALTSMPNCLGNLSHLQTLDLSYNQLIGNLSSFVPGLSSTLEYLSLIHNNFNGSFLFNSLANHTRLTVFKLSSKVGTIQDLTESSWVPLFQLKMLRLQNFIFGSTIYGFLVHQHDLCYIDLSRNKLTGAFPTWLVTNNTRLQTLLLDNNLLTELQLPKLVHGLQVLDISSNRIQDSVQEDIGNVFPKLRYMNFSSNHFHGTIPSSMGEMKSLIFLDMSSNGLSGYLPKPFLSGCYSLRFLKLSNNHLHGEIFPEHANLTGLDWLYLDGNSFNGSLGKGLLKSMGLFVMDVSENSISGAIPLWIGKMSSLAYIYMGGNKLEGPFPHQLQSLSRLYSIDISHNSFSGSIPRNLDFPFLRILRLQSNDFVGTIPDALFKSEALLVLDLRTNNFSRMSLSTIGKTSNLRVLLLRNNSLQGHISKKICQLSKIGLVDLSHNKFRGVIPSCLGNMPFGAENLDYITTVDGNFAFLDSTILQTCQYASHLYLDDSVTNGYQSKPATIIDFLTKNRYEAYQGDIINYMYGLDMSSNQLSGEIPVEIGNLINIRSLNLSSNHLTSSIPESISKLMELESLDLSNNKLEGSIPPQLADLNSLGYFNVSFNNLSGEIPFEGHLVTFEERSYIGNAHLCGLPTKTSCNHVSEPSASKEAKEEEEADGVIDMEWFYWTCGAVYISISLSLPTFLCIDSRWSREWFRWVDLFIHYFQRLKGPFDCK